VLNPLHGFAWPKELRTWLEVEMGMRLNMQQFVADKDVCQSGGVEYSAVSTAKSFDYKLMSCLPGTVSDQHQPNARKCL